MTTPHQSPQPSRRLLTAAVPVLAGLGLLLPEIAAAALPAPVAPSSGTAAAGDFIEYFKWTAKDILLIVGLVLSTVMFLIAGASAFAKFNQARQGRAEWMEVGVTTGVAAALLVLGSFLLNEAAGIIT